MLDGNACAARCWEGRARQRLNIAVENAYAAHSRQPPFFDGFSKQTLPCHGNAGGSPCLYYRYICCGAPSP